MRGDVISTLHEEFRSAINDGDDRLREVIFTQINDLKDRLKNHEKAANKTSIARMERFDAQHRSVMDQLALRIEAARDYNDGIFEEHRRQSVIAEQEREKAARALREELMRTIAVGDQALNDHITQQIASVRAALLSAETLENHRFNETKAMILSVQREIAITFAASEKAIEKSEGSIDKRLAGMNEFRSQLNEQAATFLPRETFESVNAGLAQWRESVDSRLNQQQGAKATTERREDALRPWMLWAAGGLMSIFLAVLIFAANVLTAGP